MGRQFKFENIYESIKSKIVSGEIRHDLPSMRDLSEIYEVSHITILRVFQELVKNGFVEKKTKSTYIVKNNSITSRNILLVLLRPGKTLNTMDNFATEIHLGVAKAALARRMSIFTPSQSNAIFFSHAADGAMTELAIELHLILPNIIGILLDAAISDEQIETYVKPLNRPMVIVGRDSSLPLKVVRFPTEQVCTEMAMLAAQSSFERFVLCESAQNTDHRLDHVEIWKKVLMANGRKPENIIETGRVLVNPESDAKFARDLPAVMKSEKRTLVLASSSTGGRFIVDILAGHSLEAGTDFGLMTFDGKESVRSTSPRLTTFRISGEKLGEQAVDVLLDGLPNLSYESEYQFELNDTF